MKKYFFDVAFVLIILLAVAFTLYHLAEAGSVSEEDYMSVCSANNLSMYQQSVSDNSLAGVEKGYVATNKEDGLQLDFYVFKDKGSAETALKRLVGWVAVHHGDRTTESAIKNNSWSMQTEDFYYEVTLRGKSIVCVSCDNAGNFQQAKEIISKVLAK